MKLIGAAIIFAACVYAGFSMSDRLKKRCVYLKNICAALNLLETEITFGKSRLKQAFLKIDKSGDTKGLFKSAADCMEKTGIKKAWRSAVKDKQTELRLSDDDAQTLALLGERLGMTDAEDQIKNIAYTRRRLEGNMVNAEEEYAKFGRLYRNGGILAGLFLILILT